MGFSSFVVFIITFGLFLLSVFLFPNDQSWYSSIRKPPWSPSGKAIGMIWSALYLCIALAVTLVYRATNGFAEVSSVWLVVLVFNYLANQTFNYVLFTRKNLYAAFADCFLVAISTCILLLMTTGYSKTAAWLLFPYLFWSCFVTLLSWIVYMLNKRYA
ncbi:tryptophan-rich sensory protein [Paenibacillus larvae]